MGRRSLAKVVLAVLALASFGAVHAEVAAAGTTTFPAAADAYVSQSYPWTNYGASAQLRVQKQPIQRSYLRFSVQNLAEPVSRATLRVYATASSSTGFTVRAVSGAWEERKLHYVNAPSPFVADGDPVAGLLSSGKWVAVDVTRFVAGNGTVNLALTREATTVASLASREAGFAYAPRLVVETVPPPPPRKFSFVPIGDAHVSAAAPAENFGKATALSVIGSPETRSYLRFSVTGLGLAPTRATLRLHAASASAGFAVRRVADTTWTETAITYANAPAPTVSSADPVATAVAAGSYVDVDVTPFVTGNGPLSLALTGDSELEALLSSREAGTGLTPQLLVETPSVAPDGSLAWPIPATFYYPWFPEAWNQAGYVCGAPPPAGLPATPSGCFTWYSPSAGFYTLDGAAGDAKIDADVRALTYAAQEVAIASWWGPGTKTDSRTGRLLARTRALASRLKWALYYELEGYDNPSLTVDQIRAHLDYIANVKRYSRDSAYLRVGGKPVLFVYSANDTTCEVGQRWKTANERYGFHLVFKVVPGYRTCNLGVDWHQYGPSLAEDHQKGFSFAVSPGFWLAGEAAPRLARDPARWKVNVERMRASNVHWRLVTTYNEWGEGTSVESAAEWASASGFGAYLDTLRAAAAP